MLSARSAERWFVGVIDVDQCKITWITFAMFVHMYLIKGNWQKLTVSQLWARNRSMMSFCMTQFFIFLLFHFNDLSLDIRKQVLLLDAKSGCLQNAKESPESRQLLHKLLVIPSIHMGFTRFNCFWLPGISVAFVTVHNHVTGKSPWRIMFGFKGIANYKSLYDPSQLHAVVQRSKILVILTYHILNQSILHDHGGSK